MREMVERYLRDVRDIHRSRGAVKETSYYGALEALLNEVGQGLTPKVRCIIHLKNVGGGIPDGGLFTSDQLLGVEGDVGSLLHVTIPARGAIEVKGTGEDLERLVTSDQVRGYLGTYRQVLVTNLREFLLVEIGDDDAPRLGERFSLAAGEGLFWAAVEDPGAVAAEHGERFVEYLRRMLLIRAPLTEPRFLAFFLASYARDAAARMEKTGAPGLGALRGALEQSLGLRFQGEKGEHFFRSTLVQTLFYGLFSAWVLWSKEQKAGTKAQFDWKDTGHLLHVPAISALFHQIAYAGTLRRLGLTETLEWAGAALNRVERGAFFAKFAEEQAVQYFYEPFLEAFDPELRRQLGVWYTPPEVVEYMVARVDTLLRDELGIADGLADPRVHVLDPCTGTGSYLVAVLRRIHRTLRERGDDALLGHDLKRAAMERVRGFEILPAPFVVAHLQLGLLLQNLGAPLDDAREERAGVYLTNALTGWDAETPVQVGFLPELNDERDAAAQVKREERILVVIGNPPYNGFAGVAVAEERLLSAAYRTATGTKQPQGQGLNDLYVRFFRMAERRIVEQTGEGIVCFISNYSWLDGLSFTAMRERYLEVFDEIWIDSLNGDKYKTGKVTPAGEPDPSIFSTERNREGIQVGTAIATMVRQRLHAPARTVRHRDLWGRGKLAQLTVDAGRPVAALGYGEVAPANELGLPLVPMATNRGYLDWPPLPELFPASFPGVKTSRDDVLVDIDRERLVARMERYFDPGVSDATIAREMPGAMERSERFDPEATRAALVKRGFLPERIVRYHYRPFDVRWLYWEPTTKLLDEKREDYVPLVTPDNLWIEARQKQSRVFDRGGTTRYLADNQGNGLSSYFPLYGRRGPSSLTLLHAPGDGSSPNVSDQAIVYLARLDADAESLFFHAIATLHCSVYRTEQAGALLQDWPRIPLPATKEGLQASAELGRRVAALLDPEAAVRGVMEGRLPPELSGLAAITSVDGSLLDLDRDLALTAGWGYGGGGKPTMPGRGRLAAREFTEGERAAIAGRVNPLGLAVAELATPLGETTCDVYLNERAYWRNVPAGVWGYTLGGYQVLKKWLSYREAAILERGLTPEEAREFGRIAQRIAAILLLGPELDASYRRVTGDAYGWPRVGSGVGTMRMW